MGSNLWVRCLGRDVTLVYEKLYEKRGAALELGQNCPDSTTDPASSALPTDTLLSEGSDSAYLRCVRTKNVGAL